MADADDTQPMMQPQRSQRSTSSYRKTREELAEERKNRRCVVGVTCGIAIFFIIIMVGLAIYLCSTDQTPKRENNENQQNNKKEEEKD